MMPDSRIIVGDCREVLATLPEVADVVGQATLFEDDKQGERHGH